MARITKWDSVRGCYVIVPDSTQNHIQRLGELEDRDEAKNVVYKPIDVGYTIKEPRCAGCDKPLDDVFNIVDAELDITFCPYCGQRLKWGEDE